MTEFLGRLAGLAVMATLLTACQTMNTVSLKNIKETEATRLNAQIYCTGTENCEFERLDQIPVVAEKNHRLSRQAMRSKIVRLQTDSLSDANAVYLSVPPGQHEVVIRFYPVSKDKAEKLHVIHQFRPGRLYTFRMYRERTRHQGSLLNVSAPDPLCVELRQQHKTIRRFCRPYNALTGLGEFVEKKL
ncbi:hypothetical protein QR674_12065 [Acinetobacter chinensis]|jgi:hypothetical protein|uniref:Lipoprotein n=1 Tax=Acinetobacter chinensis TaxID=2004650 RepID=A0ABU3WH32_9GAMM|nr:hypothetical protein [Acinetobacter chinensis]MDV2469715.1 hypothetical protein [Acinetobacter chinensis]WOE42002.1 hypothetical protein QSG87_02315 [Acinetobacter chinensis]